MGGSTGLHGNYIKGLEGSYLKVPWGSIDISLEALLDVEPGSTDTIPNHDISGDCTPKPSLALDENQGMLSKGPYNLRSRVPVGAKCGEYEGSLGPNPSKGGKGLGRGKRSNLSLSQERTTIEVVEGKKSLLTGILRAFTTPTPFPCDFSNYKCYRVRPSHKKIGLEETYTSV
jgi:hypothetical protein